MTFVAIRLIVIQISLLFSFKQIVQTEAVRHVKEEHAKETFQCKLCLAADPACFPYAETIKEMTGHMVLKHKDVSCVI